MHFTNIHKIPSLVVLSSLVSLSVMMPGSANAQSQPPFKTATIVVGFAPGGGADRIARIIATNISKSSDIPMVVHNRTGAGGIVAHQSLMNGPKDGSQIMMTSVGPLTILPHMSDVGFDVQKDFVPISMAVDFPNILVVPESTGIKTFAEFIEFARKNPGKVNFGSSGIGAASHMGGELLNQLAGIEMTHIPYKGGAPAMNDLLAGRLDAYFPGPALANPHIKSGRIVALATTGEKRSSLLPDLPAIGEVFPGFNATNWYAFIAPAGTSPETLEWWNAQVVNVLNDPAVKEMLISAGVEAMPTSPEELSKIIQQESAMWSEVINSRGIAKVK